MTDSHPGTPDAFVRLRASGWIISLCLHGTAVFLAALFAAKIGLAPPSSSFHWDVRVIKSSPSTPRVVASPGTQTDTSRPATLAPRNNQTASTRASSPRTSLPTAPLPRQSALPVKRHPTATPAMSPHREEWQPPFERSTATPPPESRESEQEPHPAINATSKSSETLQNLPSPAQNEASPPSDPPAPHAARLPEISTAPALEAAASPPSMASVAPLKPATQSPTKPDYGWLAGPLLQRLETIKQYPVTARLQRLEGRVVVRIVIQEDGHIASATITKSSGHGVLDQAALETIRLASPIPLSQPLEKSTITMQIPLAYFLDR